MRAFDPEVVDAVWTAFEARLPERKMVHPLGTHRQRIPDRTCFRGILIRLALGCSWQVVEALLDYQVSDTTLRARRDEWVAAGVFDGLFDEALAAYDKIIGLDLSEVAVDGSQQKAPCGGEGTGKNPTDRRKLGWKWSMFFDANGIPLGWVTDGANRTDMILLEATLEQVADRGLTPDVETLHLDRGYPQAYAQRIAAGVGLADLVVAPRRKPGQTSEPATVGLGLRWPAERTNSWLTNYGQLRRNTDRNISHRLAQLAFAITIIITAKLVDWAKRWNPQPAPIR